MHDEAFHACARCRRQAPPPDSPEREEWESIGPDVICPGCMTLEEEEALLDETRALTESIDELSERELLDQMAQAFARLTRLRRTVDPALLNVEQVRQERAVIAQVQALVNAELRRRGFELDGEAL